MESKVIVITGASSGIGAALARKLAESGHLLALAARRKEELDEIAAACGSGHLAIGTDVTKREDMERLRDKALAHFGRIDVWINNAGRGVGKKVLELTDSEFDEIINVNLRSVLYGMQVIIPYFQQQAKGHLVNVSSYLSLVPLVSYRSIYSAAKSAVNSLTASLRSDLQASFPDIAVSLVFPGAVDTDFVKNALGGTPQKTFLKPQDVREVADLMADLIDNPKPVLFTSSRAAEEAGAYLCVSIGLEEPTAD
jgi:short-subunit dehydrogenase